MCVANYTEDCEYFQHFSALHTEDGGTLSLEIVFLADEDSGTVYRYSRTQARDDHSYESLS